MRFQVIKQNKQNPFFLAFFCVFFQSLMTQASTHLVLRLSAPPSSSSLLRRNETRLPWRLFVSPQPPLTHSPSPKKTASRKPLSDRENSQLFMPSNRRLQVISILQREFFSLQSCKNYGRMSVTPVGGLFQETRCEQGNHTQSVGIFGQFEASREKGLGTL